ncbi:hypothetical protein [Microbacterium sp. Clip185]|uniref:hypothetical protein n=1 Tax=Microbacterium sp. Clip185 TaxID=3025663 RepID=UPI002365596A|nr:hypothetical protein [Microbacterium sp. Clip185]WDG18052.1 hypothetical protein PQV94_15715 [Microbacterium sp. Clip185]
MEHLFAFLQSYWWLAFPLMGVAGGAARAWERGAKRRHERRLELIRAKSGAIAPVPAEALPQSQPQPQPTASALHRTLAEHDATTARWLEYELDVAKMIAYPTMSDGRQELTAAFLRAKRVADRMRPASADAEISAAELTAYQNAVTDYEVAFDVAEREARRVRDAGFTPSERKRLDTAQQLLAVAVDEAATPAERQLAYRRVREELDGLISLSDAAIDELERRVALELPAAAAQNESAGSEAGLPPSVPESDEEGHRREPPMPPGPRDAPQRHSHP